MGVFMRRPILAAVLTSCACVALAAPTPKEQLLSPPQDARHYLITSSAGKHGDIWAWRTPDGKRAYRMSMSLRGWITEDDELITPGPDGRPTAIAIRGYTDQGDATEDFSVDPSGTAHWKSSIDQGSAPYGARRYNSYGGPWLATENDVLAYEKALLTTPLDASANLLPLVADNGIGIQPRLKLAGAGSADFSGSLCQRGVVTQGHLF